MDDTLDVVQRGSQTAAAIAVNKFEARLAAGSDRLAQLSRKDQGLAAETETLDKAHCQITFLNPARRGDQLVARAHERIRAGRSGIYDVTVTREGQPSLTEFRGHSRVDRR
jgi:acyl-coenzyme A thioesterase PaaI-like protein